MIQTLFGSTEEQPSFLDRMKEAVTRTRESLSERIDDIASLGKEIDRDTLDELEATLIGADLGTPTTAAVLETLRTKVDRKQIGDIAELKRVLKEELLKILNVAGQRPVQKVDGEPEVILVVGVNGTGKTTSTGKLAYALRAQGKSVLLAAADTFRAAAIEQLEIWGDRTGVEVIKNKPGGDPSAVLFDALQAAKARNIDYVIVDTAGRLHTKSNLMTELEKMRRTAQRFIPSAPHETLLVMDATTGPKRPAAGAPVHPIGGRHRNRADQAGRNGKGRRRRRHLEGTRSARSLRRSGREGRRPVALQCRGLCGIAV